MVSKEHNKLSLVLSILSRLGSGKVNSFNERLKSQKIQYLAQSAGLTVPYPFNLYLRGPYSPELAKSLFHANELEVTPEHRPFVSEELEEKFLKFRKIIISKRNRELELAATLHWLRKEALLSKREVKSKIKSWKGATDEEVSSAEALLESIENES